MKRVIKKKIIIKLDSNIREKYILHFGGSNKMKLSVLTYSEIALNGMDRGSYRLAMYVLSLMTH